MRNTLKALALSLGILSTASMALAEESTSPGQETQTSESMMQGDDMSRMMDMMQMMQMMQQMGPMMERCNKMMEAMTGHMNSTPGGPEAPEDNG